MVNTGGQESTRTVRRSWRWITIVAGLAIVAGGVGLALHLSAARANGASGDAAEEQAEGGADGAEGGEQGEKAPVPVEVEPVRSGEISAYISSSANLVAEYEVKVLAEVEGRVGRLMTDEGRTVRRGQALATLVRDDEEIRLKKAQLREANARSAYDRAVDLHDKELISREEFDKLSIDFEIAGQELAEARWALDKTTVRAPFEGRVTQRMIQPGQHIRPGDELFQITDFDPLVARIFLPERDVLSLAPGTAVRIQLNADAGVRFDGRIRQISSVVDTATGTVKVTIEAAQPPAGVRPGSFVSVHIVRETRPDTLLVPRRAVLRELQKAHVFVAGDEAAQKREIELGLEEGDWVEALSGVAAGDRIIVAGQGGLKDGTTIKVLDDPAPSPAAAQPAS